MTEALAEYGADAIEPTVIHESLEEAGDANAIILMLEDELKGKDQTIAELKEKLRHDSLSGLLNKATWHDELDKRIEKKEPFGVMIIDLDNFKKVNDNLGHDAGDKVLAEVGKLLNEGFRRKSDFLPNDEGDPTIKGRIGGDEFAITIDLSDRGDSFVDADQRMSQIEKHLEQIWDEYISTRPDLKKVELGISIGPAIWNSVNPVDAETLFKEADDTMYEKKRNKKIAKVRRPLGITALKSLFTRSS